MLDRFQIEIDLFDEYPCSLRGNFLQEIKINYLFLRQIRTIFNQIQVEIIDCLEVVLEGLEFIHFHLLLYHWEILNDVILQVIDGLSLVLDAQKIDPFFYLFLKLLEIGLALFSNLLTFEHLEAFCLDVFYLCFEFPNLTRQIIESPLHFLNKEVVTLFL